MFKKLKDKIAEEVKQSPLKSVQQLAQAAAQAVVSPSSSSVFEPSNSNDKFCIEEDDIEEEEKAVQVKAGGFTSVALTGQSTSPQRAQRHGFRSSSSSFTTEADNFFPVFESQPTNFHVQSDWESASEVEDRYSQLEHINKESLYEAYRKVYNRYNKMKNKYHELVSHYRHLERERDKAKTVLSDTQDKALLRISELREQCLLEQQAKAHLEEALRNELEERDHIINTLKTKVQYLKAVSDGPEPESLDMKHLSKEETDNLIDFTDNINVPTVPFLALSSDTEKISWLEKQLKECKKLLNNKASKIKSLDDKLQGMRKLDVDEEGKISDVCDQKSEEELNIYKSVISLINELSKDVKSLDDNTFINLHLKSVDNSVNQQASSRENVSEKPLVDESTKKLVVDDGEESKAVSLSDRGDGSNSDSCGKCPNNVKDICDLHNDELKKHYNIIKELEIQNQLLSERMKNESEVTEQVRIEVNSLNSIIDFVKAQLKIVNENFRNGVLNEDNTDLLQPAENELIQELNSCITHLCQTKSELKNVESLKLTLESEMQNLKDQMYEVSLKKDLKAKDSENQNQIESQDENVIKELIAKNDNLNKELDSLKHENIARLGQQESLCLEISELTKKNEELKNDIQQLINSLTVYEKESNANYEALQQANLDFTNQKNTLQNKISSLTVDCEQAKEDLSTSLETKETQSNELFTIKKANDDLNRERCMLQKKLDELENELQQSKKEYVCLLEIKEKLCDELSLLRKDNNNITAERDSFHEKMCVLEKDVEKNKLVSTLALEEKEHLSEKFAVLRTEYDILAKEKNDIQNKIETLEKEFESGKINHSKYVDSSKQLSDELSALKTDRDKWVQDRISYDSQIDELKKYADDNKASYTIALENNKKLSEELVSLKKELHDLNEERETMQNTIEKLEENVINSKKEHSSSVEINDQLSNEIASLKDERKMLSLEKDIMQDKFDKMVDEFEKCKIDCVLLVESKDELSDKLSSLRKEHDDIYFILNETKKNLESQQETYEDLNQKLSKSLKNKCDVLKEKCLENTRLKNEADSLSRQINETNCLLEQISKDKNLLISNLLEKFAGLKSIRQLHQNLFDFVQQFRAEIINELSGIKIKVENDLIYKVNNILEKNEACEKQINELEYKSKKDIDSYNSKVKFLQEKLQNADEIPISQLSAQKTQGLEEELCLNKKMNYDLQEQCNGIEIKFSGDLKSWEEKIMDLNKSVLFYQDKCNDLEVNLCQALYIMKYFRNLCKQKLEPIKCVLNDGENDDNSNLNEVESENVQKEIVAMDLFINECESKYLSTNVIHNISNHKIKDGSFGNAAICKNTFLSYGETSKSTTCNETPPDHWIVATKYLDEVSNANSSTTNNEESKITVQTINSSKLNDGEFNSLEVQQLRQEIKLKDDIINKLQCVVEKYEHEQNIRYFKNPQSSESECTRDRESVSSKVIQSEMTCNYVALTAGDSNTSDNINKISSLEQENKTLLQKLKNIEENQKLKMKDLIDEYEQKLEEKREEIKLSENEKQGKEKKFLMNEMKEQIENLQQDLDERGDAYEKLYEEHHQNKKSKEEQIHQLRNSYEKEMREQDKKWRACLDRRIAEEEERHQQEIADLTCEWNSERKELETASQLAVSVMESGSNSGDLLRRQVQALTLQLNGRHINSCAVCEQRSVKREHRQSHNSSRSIQDWTEMEYLRNIMYEYMMGKEPMVLAKVLCALMKFDENQTKDIVLKEEQKITLFGQLGIL